MLLILLIATTVRYFEKASENRSAILRWRPQVRALLDGHDVYRGYDARPGGDDEEGGGYPNPPVMGVLQGPLLLLPPVAAAMLFFAAKVVMAFYTVRWSLAMAAGETRLPMWAVGVAVALILSPIMGDLTHGNVNIVIAFLTIAGLWAYVNGRDAWAGVLIGVAAAFKVTPALFLIYFLYKRQFRTAAWMAAAGVVASFALPAIVLGPAHSVEMFWAWFQTMVMPYATGDGAPPYTTQINQSLAGIVYRLLTHSPGIEHGDATYYINFLSLSPSAARWILKALAVVVLIAMALVCRTPTQSRRDWRLACEFSLVLIAMLLISERSWKHHYIVMALPYAALAACMAVHAATPGLRRYLAITAAGVFLHLYVISSDLAELVYPEGDKFIDAYGSYIWGAVAVFAALCIVLWRQVKPAASNPSTSPSPH